MKKIMLVLAALLCAFSLSAQTEHMTFKGIPMQGTVDQFAQKLAAKGCTIDSREKGVVAMIGDFAGYKECPIGLIGSNDGSISKVIVLFEAQEAWSSLSIQYNTLKSMLTTKYGEPAGTIEEFQNSYVNTDSERLHEMLMDRGTWQTSWATPKGNIYLIISHYDLEVRVSLVYEDAINSEKAKQDAYDDL